jgi:hypothetical protein
MKFLSVPRFLAVVLALAIMAPLAAPADGVQRSTYFSVEGAYYLPDNKGYGVSDGGFAPITYSPEPLPGSFAPIGGDEGRDLGTTWGSAEIQLLLTHRVTVPFLRGSGPLSSGNNATFSFTGALTPVSTRFEARANLTPIAFLDFFAGAMIGTGWDIGLFNCMGLNDDGTGVPESSSFQGMVLKAWAGGTFKFDLAALVPGEWTHVVALLSPKLQYALFTGADRAEAWMWEADKGENFNGFKFYGTYFLGYQMPLVLDMAGLLVETERNLGYVKDLDTEDPADWGSDYLQITVSPVFSFALSESSALFLLFQFRREQLYDESDDSIFANYFRNRNAVGTYWDFYRIAFSYELTL